MTGLTTANGPPGTTEPFYESTEGQPAVSVRVEPDIDGDDYGDETQDRCPKSYEHHGSCPHVTIAFWAAAKRRSIWAHVMATSAATVQVYGQVGWGIRPRGQGTPPKARLIVGLSSGTKDVAGEDARSPASVSGCRNRCCAVSAA